MKKKYSLTILVVALIIISFLFGYLFRDSAKKDIEVIQQSQSMEVYEEFSANKILEIEIHTVNVNLRVIPSENKNIRIIYRPSVEPSNFTYHLENKIVFMKVDEVASSTSIVPSNREMIYLYLPTDTDVTLHFTSDTGFLDITNTDLRNVYANTKSGIVTMSHANVALDINVETVSGKVVLKELTFDHLKVKTNTALISCALSESGSLYQQKYQTEEGTISVNGEIVSSIYEQESENEHHISLETRFGDIRVKMGDMTEDE